MARPRPSLSITLPSNFEFHYNDGQPPKTPDQQRDEPKSTAEPPPPPPRQAYKVKRRRRDVPAFDEPAPLTDTDTVIPTIEMSEPVSELSSPIIQPSNSANGFLAPLSSIQRLVTPPKTPAPKIDNLVENDSPANEWDLINDSRDSKKPGFQRSASVCSTFSNSSVSSCGSSAFSAPTGSCTSPESVATDPFMEDDITKADKFILSPMAMSSSPTAKRVKRHKDVKWTPEMDQHLENTYIMYLRDPRVTPFKTLPGVAPPLGVCSRVANKAKRTWNPHRQPTPTPLDTVVETQKTDREGSPDTIRPEPSASKEVKQQPQWPRSDAATRRRLRKLVKGKPALSAHYQRLLRTRSPSPFTSSTAPSRSSEPPSAAFSAGDMKMSLITSTSETMQPEGPLAQLASEEVVPNPEPRRPQSQRSSRPADWFARIGRSQAHQKSLSLQSSLSVDEPSQPQGSLASPFDAAPSRSHLLHSMGTTKSLGRSEFNGKNVKVPSLDSPIEMHGAPTMPRSLKRRFKSDEEKPRRPVLEDVFGPQQPDEVGVVRNRGFSVGAVRAADNLTKIFKPPVPPASNSGDSEMTEAPPPPFDVSHLGPVGSRSAPRRLAEPVPRLGSPFMEVGTVRPNNTFPRSWIPTTSNPQPFQDRLRELATQHKQS